MPHIGAIKRKDLRATFKNLIMIGQSWVGCLKDITQGNLQFGTRGCNPLQGATAPCSDWCAGSLRYTEEHSIHCQRQ